MKPLLTFIILLFITFSNAQSPAEFNYQGVARDAGGNVITGEIALRFSLLENADDGQVRYIESHTVTTDAQGIFTARIGDGVVVSGDMTDLDWGKYQYYLRTEMKTLNDVNYIIMGATKLVSVPYAMYANASGTSLQGGAGINIADDIVTNTGDLSDENELQTLSIDGQELFISDGNSVELPDASSTNEIQTLSLNGQQLSLSKNGGTVTLPGGNEHWKKDGALIYSYPLSNRVSIGNDNNFGAKLLVTGINNEHGGTFVTDHGDAGYFTSANGNALLVAQGNVGIGNTTPTHKFEVQGKSHFSSNTGAAITVGFGNVGIGVVNPIARLSVDGADGMGLSVRSDAAKALDVRSYGVFPAGYFHSEAAPCVSLSGGSGYLMHAQQISAGTQATTQGLLLKLDGSEWKMYIDSYNDYNWAFNNVLKGYIRDSDGYYHNTSDRRLKKNIQPVGPVLSKLTALQAYTYQYVDARDDSAPSLGFIAQEVEALFPQLVTEKEGYKTLCYDHFAVLAVEAIKEQQVTIDALTARLAALEQRLNNTIPTEKEK